MNRDTVLSYIAPIIEQAEAHSALLIILISSSFLLAVAAIIALPVIIIAIPEDYFITSRGGMFTFTRQHPVLRTVLLILKNGVGILFLLLGLMFLFTPGQGLLTIFIALMLMNFPGKRRLEQRLIRINGIRRGANWIRKRAGKGELRLPGDQPQEKRSPSKGLKR
jgi:hypothetical protein